MIATMALLLPLCANAQSSGLFSKKKIKMQKDMTEYLQKDAVPVVDGRVTFSTTISVPGVSKDEIYRKVLQWADLRYTPQTEHGEWTDKDYYKNLDNSMVREADKETGSIVCVGHEEQVFSNKTLAKDYCNTTYLLEIGISDGSATVTMTNIIYTYNLTAENERLMAEDWITDEEAINKKGNLNRISGKFRVKTIDLKDELFSEINDAIIYKQN